MNLRERFEKDMDMDSKFEIAGMDCPTWGYVAYLESLLEWIPVSERLPEEEDNYLTLHRFNVNKDIDYLYQSLDWFEDGKFTEHDIETGEDYEIFPLYWRENSPLPPLPEVKE
jgi:hypothetical protein